MKKITTIIIFALIAVLLVGTISPAASEPYDTYTYSIDGEQLSSPDAYRVQKNISSSYMNIGKISDNGVLSADANDIVTDDDGNVYISDTSNRRVVVLNKYYQAKTIVSDFDDKNTGMPDALSTPKGIYVTTSIDNDTNEKTRFLYVCDTGNKRVVVFKEMADGSFGHYRTIEKPVSSTLATKPFEPSAIAVDLYGRIFLISEGAYEGVYVLSSNGDFTGFIGVQKTTLSLIDMIWRRFQSSEQRATEVQNYADPYNNVTVDDEGFVYVTYIGTAGTQYGALRSKNAAASPVKKLNSAGTEIMKRNGFFDPSGEVAILNAEQVSKLTDVAIGEEGAWTILDRSRSRVFTYDQNGNLLFAFGDKGNQVGSIAKDQVHAIAYQKVPNPDSEGMDPEDPNYDEYDYNLIMLYGFGTETYVAVYEPTDYYDTIISALRNQNNHNYSDSIFFWQDVLKRNNNFDLAYIGIGKALFSQGKYEEAQLMLKAAYETSTYDKAFMEIRKEIIQKWMLPLVIGAILILVLFFKFLGYAKKKNKITSLKVGRKTYGEELLYVFHLIFHPFDGFWDLKHEKRGSVRASLTFMILTIAAFFYQAIGQGYSFNPRGDYSTVVLQVIAVAVPVILWCVGNWCLTTLFDGEGSFKDIFIATGYSLAPLPVFVVISTILTNLMTAQEGKMVNLIVTLGYVWVFILLFFGTMITHDYTMGKNFITILGTIVAMAIIIFIIVLFSSLLIKMVSFVITIASEISGRV